MGALPEYKAVAMRDSIADTLRRALFDRHFGPGEALVESAIAAEMKVSRGPVREALLLLMQEGLVTHSQNRGFAVPQFTPTDQNKTDQVRCVLETMALQLARDRVTEDDLNEMERALAAMVDQFRKGDLMGRLGGELAFHSLIWKKSDNPYLVSALERVSIPNFTFATAYHMNRPDLTLELFEKQHQLYLDYLRRKTEKSADECVRYHLGFPVPAFDQPPVKENLPVGAAETVLAR